VATPGAESAVYDCLVVADVFADVRASVCAWTAASVLAYTQPCFFVIFVYYRKMCLMSKQGNKQNTQMN